MTVAHERTEILRHDSNARRSRAVVYGDLIHFAGQVGEDLSGDITKQTQEALARIERILKELGSDKGRMISATIWLRDMADFDAMNAVWDAWIDPENPPARCCCQNLMADERVLVEIIPLAAR